MKQKVTIEVVNIQKIKKISLKELKTYTKKILSVLKIPSKKISIVLCNNKKIKKINQEFFAQNASTDVIAFPLQDEFLPQYLGEVVISVEEAVKAAGKYNNNWKKELLLYLIHGILHLFGYDDIKEAAKVKMDKKQQEVLACLLTWLKKT